MPTRSVTRVDPHVKILDEVVVQRAKEAEVDVLVYAPHFTHLATTRERATRYSDDELLVVPARECFTGRWSNRRHVLAVDPDDPIPDFMTFEATMDELASQDAAVLAPHPGFLSMSLAMEDILAYSQVIDAVEVYCSKNWSFHTRRMESIADQTGLPRYASSYAHLYSTVGDVWVEYETAIETAADLREALGTQPTTVHREQSLGHALTSKLEFFDLVRENTIEKFDRVVVEDIEATNPYNPSYDSRFADLSAY